jgi:predicted MPP superfamily phosphohydrolase
LPLLGPVRSKSATYDQGLRRRPWTQVYTSRGLGNTLLPLRFRARPELALLELTAAPRPPRRGTASLAGPSR